TLSYYIPTFCWCAFIWCARRRDLHSFPTRRSSDLAMGLVRYQFFGRRTANFLIVIPMATPEVVIGAALLSMFLIYGIDLGFQTLDRKSTRLNSSHVKISYAVFCLKKKNTINMHKLR